MILLKRFLKGSQRVALLGAIISGVALVIPFLKLKPNRVDAGVAYRVWELPQVWPILLIAACIGAIVLLSYSGAHSRIYSKQDRFGPMATAIAATILTISVLIVIGAPSTRLIGADMPFGRITPGLGFWLLLAAGFALINDRAASLPRAIGFIARVAPLLCMLLLLFGGQYDNLGVILEFANRRERFLGELLGHISLSFSAVGAATLIGVPLGVIAWQRHRLERPIFTIVNAIQTIPSLALFGLMIAPLAFLSRSLPALRAIGVRGIGNTPALIALTLYALLPIIRNAYTSLAVIPEAVVDAGVGMGMNRPQLFRHVEFPMSLPVVLSGIRTSAVQAIGNTTIAALIGARGLGNFVFQGLGQASPDLIVLGVAPIIIMAVVLDRGLGFLIDRATPTGLKREVQPTAV